MPSIGLCDILQHVFTIHHDTTLVAAVPESIVLHVTKVQSDSPLNREIPL